MDRAYRIAGRTCGAGSGVSVGSFANGLWFLFSEPTDGTQVVFETEDSGVIFEIESEDR